MTERWQVADQTIEIRRRRYQRTLRMKVAMDGTLHISCAATVSRREILGFILENRRFIENQLKEAKRIQEKFPPKKFESGEGFVFLGLERPLEIRESSKRTTAFIQNNRLVLEGRVNSFSERKAAIRAFYRRCGRNYMLYRIDHFSKMMGLFPEKVSFRSQTTRWGSCSAHGHISLNWRLIAAPSDVLDYVLVHELAHLRHHDHSPHFWALVSEFSPQFKHLKKWLREHQWAFDFLGKGPADA